MLHRSRSISHGFNRTMARGRGSSRYGFHGSQLSTGRPRSRYTPPAKKRSLRGIDDPPDVIPDRKARIASIRRSQKNRRDRKAPLACPSSYTITLNPYCNSLEGTENRYVRKNRLINWIVNFFLLYRCVIEAN
ncbi:hypothetical protein PUN28_019877 [Cardiocondyla obscurior]|uniref:Uncharacterized protein n=1 Tax=Cardiocondyla obscurior TaxID=286306 RepID=A0AAW2E7W4_9HYME